MTFTLGLDVSLETTQVARPLRSSRSQLRRNAWIRKDTFSKKVQHHKRCLPVSSILPLLALPPLWRSAQCLGH